MTPQYGLLDTHGSAAYRLPSMLSLQAARGRTSIAFLDPSHRLLRVPGLPRVADSSILREGRFGKIILPSGQGSSSAFLGIVGWAAPLVTTCQRRKRGSSCSEAPRPLGIPAAAYWAIGQLKSFSAGDRPDLGLDQEVRHASL